MAQARNSAPQSAARSSGWLWWAAIALVLGWFAYTAIRANSIWTKPYATGYYEMLTDAITSGQTHLKLVPDPRLAELANPWGGAQGIPRAHDATYFNGKYYLYFGIAPAILLYAPWHLLTGTFLSDGVGTGVFCAVGFLLAAGFYRRCQRRFFPGLSSAWNAAAVLLLGLGSFIQFELRSTDFYQVPIAAAFACTMGTANALLLVATSRNWTRQLLGLVLAGSLAAVSVGARPNHLVDFLAVGVVALWAVRRRAVSGALLQAMTAVGVPALLVGGALAAYNYARFGSVFEFGIHYQFAAIDMRHFKLFGPEFFPNAFAVYFFSGREYSLYFPYIRQTTENIGLVPWAPFALLAALLPFTWRGQASGWRVGVGALGLLVAANLVGLLFYFYVFDRYVLEFLPGLMLLGCLSISALSVMLAERPMWRRGLVGIAAVLAAYTFTHSFVHGLPVGLDRAEGRWLARGLNHIAYAVEGWRGVRYGPVVADLEFKEGAVGVSETLVATGHGRDLVYLKYDGPRTARIGFFHTGAGGPLSDPFDFEPGRRYRLRVDLGSLYPPPEHAIYRDWNESELTALRTRVDVSLDGRSLLRFAAAFHQADATSVQLGRNPDAPDDHDFRGAFTLVERSGLPERATVDAGTGEGPVRLRLKFPPFVAMVGQPLLATGRNGAGDLVYVFYVGPNQVRFGHDCWSRPLAQSETVGYDPTEEQVIEIDTPALHRAQDKLLEGREHLRIRFNGRLVYDAPRPFFPAEPAEVYIGHNAIRASSTEVNFNGPSLHADRLSRWPEARTDGAVALTLKPAAEHIVTDEPLLVTGKTGAGEFVFIRYVDKTHFEIGYDKWGVGGPVSELLPLPASGTVVLEISTGALYAEGVFGAGDLSAAEVKKLRSTVQVRYDGRVVLSAATASYPASESEIVVGKNPIGGSSCGERLTGEILQMERIGPARLK